MGNVTEFVQNILQENYDLGKIKKVESIKAGDTNNSFFAFAEKDGAEKKWYVRQYNTAEQERDIIYEHAFEKYYSANVKGAMQTMLPVENRTGKTWLVAEYEGRENFYAVFNTISGLEPYSWEYNEMPNAAKDSCAEICARFQAWAYGFEGPEGSGRREPGLEEQFKLWREDLPAAQAEKRKNLKVFRRFTDYYEKEIPFLLDTIDFCEKELKENGDQLKKCICHKDLNPGNVMFDENDKVIAVFDLDWVNTDYRLYDLAWMCYQALASWETDSWGDVAVEKIGRFISVYNQTMKETGCGLGELTAAERSFLPVMMIIGAVKVIMDFTCYENHEQEVHRMFVNTWRFVESVHFMRGHLGEIRASIEE